MPVLVIQKDELDSVAVLHGISVSKTLFQQI